MNAAERVAEYARTTQLFADANPDTMHQWDNLIGTAFANGGPLDPAMMQLIIIAVSVAKGNEPGIYVHTDFYIKSGGTREALVSALTMVILACGGHAYGHAGQALDIFDQLSDK